MKFILAIFLLFLNINTFAQGPFYYRISTAEGLTTNTIYDVKQDKKIFYFATSNDLIAINNNTQTEIKDQHSKTLLLKEIYMYKNQINGLTKDDVIIVVDKNHKISNFELPAYIKNSSIEKIKVLDNLLFIFTSNAVYEYDLVNKNSSKMINLTPTFTATDVERIGSHLYFATTYGVLKKNKYNFTSNYQPWLDVDKILINSF